MCVVKNHLKQWWQRWKEIGSFPTFVIVNTRRNALCIAFLLDCLTIFSSQYFKINQAFLLITTLFNSPASPHTRMRAHEIYCTVHDQRPYQSDIHSAPERLLLWLTLQFLTGCWSSPSIPHNLCPFNVAALLLKSSLSFLFLYCFTRNPSDKKWRLERKTF